ncbi:probable cytochrome P450 12d1 proximal, mitochondrial [Pecten maximus]|uniref:probable cytochrome P450 12d1 proximal, mitochondrial n=1 Tax=Pecten maximus TaxID=6579 RepID=UPI0014580F54|nr:probable cytochrome P450 12d1 proximal, mitochondrial [Pecten maximus]XP_033752270.1 probable cytochrome P450 12d1 proximal, mitochondrial [Pecten maximus]XP_033752271.1 probable cytochrome P450 12d1 proximal, mitochondrial [Pecten maximus]XP_033752272.1 probable cytochrome P450 12d1 proximal, mitochondrial [Pecten maximus]
MSGRRGRLLMSLKDRLCRKPKLYHRNKSTMISSISSEDIPATEMSRIDSTVRPFNEVPGPKCYPFIGTLPYYLPGGRFHKKEHNEVSKILRKEFGNLYKETLLGGKTMVHTFDAADVETVYRNEGKYPVREAFMTLGHFNKKFQSNSQGLLTSQMERWHHLRVNVQKKMLLPKTVAAYIPEHCLVANDLMCRIASSKETDGIIEDLRPHLTKYAAECIGVVCFNKRLGAFLDGDNALEASRFIKAVQDVMLVSHLEVRQFPLFKLFNTPTFNKFIKSQTIIKEIAIKYSNIALEAAQQRLEAGDSVDGEHGDLVPYLMSKSSLSNEDVLTVISEFIFAGVDTTSHHLSFLLYLLGQHPHIQNKLYDEIRTHLPTNESPITEKHIRNMPYLKAVAKETHRLLPVAPAHLRQTNVDTVLSGYHIPAGTTVAMHSTFIGQDAKEFPEPDVFKPERWIRSNTSPKKNHPFAMTPFGFGPRGCIGMRFAEQETQIAVIKILQRYRLEYVGEPLRLEASITFKPANKMAFRFTKRL